MDTSRIWVNKRMYILNQAGYGIHLLGGHYHSAHRSIYAMLYSIVHLQMHTEL